MNEMTTRGTNPSSISPPVPIPPQRHTIPSGTPPPNQQLYPGQSPGLVQGPAFNLIQPQYQQGEQFLPYQAYGSAPNDLRGAASSSGRGGAGPGNMAQSGTYYAQTNQNMRPSQPPPPNHSQQFYFGQAGQNSMRHSRPTSSASNNPIMFLQPNPNNMVISTSMYPQTPRMPMYPQGGPQYQTRFSQPGGMIYFNGVQRASVPMQAQGMGPPPPPREKRFITISDPNTGRNITDEIISSHQQSTEDKGEQDDSSANDKGVEIRKNFTRQVVERMKTGEAAASPSQHSTEPLNPAPQPGNPPQQNQPSQEHPQMPVSYPPGHPQQPQSSSPMTGAPGPGSMMRPSPIRMSSPAPAINLSVPPPQLPPNMHYNRHNPNQQSMPGQAPVQAQHVMAPKVPPPASNSSVAMTEPVPSTRSVETSASAAHETLVAAERKPTPQVETVVPQSDIPVQKEPAVTEKEVTSQVQSKDVQPAQEASSIASSQKVQASSPPQEIKPAPVQSVTDTTGSPAVVEPVSVASRALPASESTPQPTGPAVPSVPAPTPQDTKLPKAELPNDPKQQVIPVRQPSVEAPKKPVIDTEVGQVKEETGSGASTQGSKDGRKGKKNKKDFSRKESGGSEMDAFIDGKDSGVDSEPGQAVQDQRRLSESNPQDKTPTPSPQTDAESLEIKKEKEPSPVPMPSGPEDKPVENKSPEKEVTLVKADAVKIQNGTETIQDIGSQPEKQASVPNDIPTVVNSVPEEIPADKENDIPPQVNNQHIPEENGTPKIEDVEPSKAEEYTKLKKSGGKIVYDRDYLMELRSCASSKAKPDGLPELEIILDQPSPYLTRSAGPADFTPSYFQSGTNPRHAPPIGKSSSRGRQRPGDMPGTPRVIKSISMSNDSKQLHHSVNPWKPTKKEEKDDKKKLEGDILFIMNRLTPTNFEKLAAEMKNLNVNTYEDLQFMVKTFFDKVTLETKFVEAYALLCKVMSGLRVPPPDSTMKESMATFRVVMLTKCQQEFEADKAIIFEDPEEKKKKLEADNPEKTPERDEMIETTLYKMKLRRMKFYGNIRFIGELFKLGMLTENIMHDCIFRLLKARDDDSLVSLCNLLTTVGRNLDTEKAKPRMDQYFSQMTKIADERKSRIKFTLRDVVELRQSNWVPRKQATGPKKIDEVHKDFAQEQARNQYLASQSAQLPRPDNSQVGSRRGSRQRQDENKMGEDGWNTVGNSKSFRIDVSKMKISKNVVDDTIQLGPGGGAHKSVWSKGSHGGTQQPPQDDKPALGNRFTALTNDDAKRSFPRSPSRGDGPAGRSLRQGQTVGHGRGKILSRSSHEGERRDAIANTRSFMGGRSQNSSRDNSWNRDERRQQYMGPRSSWERDNPMTRSDSAVRTEEFKTPAPPAVKQMTESEIESKAVNILDEYINIRDLAEAKLCFKELQGQNHLHLVVTAGINNVLEKRDDARDMTGNIFNELVKSNILTVNTYIKGLNEVLEYASDMVIDIPTLWNCLAQVICPLLVGGTLPWSKLKQAFTPHLDNKDGAKLMAALLSLSVEKQGEKETAQEWQNSGLSWTTYLKPDEINSFVTDKKLGFTLGAMTGGGACLLPDLEKMIRSRTSNSECISYIEKTVQGSKSDPNFIRALTTAVISSSINENKNINEDVIKNNKDILQRYLGNSIDLQLQALYAIQTLMVKLEHPSGVLTKVFDLLYNEVSMEDEAFYRWEKCSEEQEGKGTCLLQVRQFFTWLRENEEPDTES